jgi:hypothetical protein
MKSGHMKSGRYHYDLLYRHSNELAPGTTFPRNCHIPQELKEKHPEIDWRGFADIGNVLRHAYD